MRHTSWLNSLLSLNHLPPSLHAKEHIKWPSYLFLFLENCLSLASLLSFFDIFVQMENKTLQSLLTLRKQGYQPLRIVHTLHPSFTNSFHKTRWNLYSWCFYFFPPDYPLTSSHPSPSAQPHILKSLRAILGAECTVCFLMPAMNYFSFFSHYPLQYIWLDAYLFTLLTQLKHVAWKDFNCQIQKSDFRTVFENGDTFIDTCYESTVNVVSKRLVPGYLFHQVPK